MSAMEYTKEEKTALWLDGVLPDYARRVKVLELVREPYALVRRFSSYAPAVRAAVGEEAFERMRASLASPAYMNGLLARYAQKGICAVTYYSAAYPAQLRELPDPPLVLYCQGDVQLLGTRMFCIVGSRHTPPGVCKLTKKWAGALAEHFTIVSGCAAGGDESALRGATEAGGKAVCVLAHGTDHCNPESSRSLVEAVRKSGLVLSEYPPETPPRGYLFPARNRILAGLSEGVLVVSGGIKSGTRITAERAYAYGRDVFAFPYPPGAAAGAGCNALIKEYAKLADDLVDIPSAFGIHLTAAEEEPLSAAERAVLSALDAGEAHVGALAAQLSLAQSELSAVLILLEMKGFVANCGGNRYRKL